MSQRVSPSNVLFVIDDIQKQTYGGFNSELTSTTYKMIGRNTRDVFTNKTLTDPSNVIAATGLSSGGGIVNITGSATSGRVLEATSATTAEWKRVNFPVITYIYRPGYAGTDPYIYDSWADMCADIDNDSCSVIMFDNTLLPFGDPCIIPAGNWDMTNVKWMTGSAGLRQSGGSLYQLLVQVEDGATLNGLGYIDGPILINFTGTTQPAIVLNNSTNALFRLNLGVNIICTGTQPFIDLTDGNIIVNLFVGTRVGVEPTSPTPVFRNSGSGTMIVSMYGMQLVSDNVFGGSGIINIINFTPTGQISIPINQPAATQLSLQYGYICSSTYTRAAAPTVNDDSVAGYKAGDIWIDSSSGNNINMCVLADPGAAVWKLFTTT